MKTIKELEKALETQNFAAEYWHKEAVRLSFKLDDANERAIEHEEEAKNLRKIISRLLAENNPLISAE